VAYEKSGFNSVYEPSDTNGQYRLAAAMMVEPTSNRVNICFTSNGEVDSVSGENQDGLNISLADGKAIFRLSSLKGKLNLEMEKPMKFDGGWTRDGSIDQMEEFQLSEALTTLAELAVPITRAPVL
jgi:hypothetical protein